MIAHRSCQHPPLNVTPKSPDGKRLRGPEKALARKRALSARAEADLGAWLAGEQISTENP